VQAELGRAHASAKLSEWDGVGQGLRRLVSEKDAELAALRASAAEGEVRPSSVCVFMWAQVEISVCSK
jgi:hypothetical protein